MIDTLKQMLTTPRPPHELAAIGWAIGMIEGKKPARARAPKDQPPIQFPAGLEDMEFRLAWIEWGKHRAELKKPLTRTAIEQQLKKLADMGSARAIAAIRHSIANGWQGIFEPTNGAVNGKPGAASATARRMQRFIDDGEPE